MKMKSFAMLAVSGLLAASFAYVGPAMADDINTNGSSGSMMQSPADTMLSQNSQSGAQSDSSIGSTDEGSPDTATGDDDY